jgi:hypothetical protein
MEQPLLVDDLSLAAQLLGQPLDMVKDASTRCRPYPHADGRRQFHSIAQLARALGLDTSRERFEVSRPKGEPRPVHKITKEQAEAAAAAIAGGATLSGTARSMGVGRNTLTSALIRHGLR